MKYKKEVVSDLVKTHVSGAKDVSYGSQGGVYFDISDKRYLIKLNQKKLYGENLVVYMVTDSFIIEETDVSKVITDLLILQYKNTL